ncbi:MAG TPA: hypothetical protein VL992_09480 [Tepidisphaeraceae bacterium]|nr:hypothetical protein [Tepidisphaeraceae bacterium]
MLAFLCLFGMAAGALYWLETQAPWGITPESPREYGPDPKVAIAPNPFGIAPAVDVQAEGLFTGTENPTTLPASISLDMPFLADLCGPDEKLLLRHLATSAKWCLSRDFIGNQGVFVAQRRFVVGGMWQHPFMNMTFHGTGEFAIQLGIGDTDWTTWDEWRGTDRTIVQVGDGIARLNVKHDIVELDDSYLIVAADSTALEISEEHPGKARPFSAAAIAQLQGEFQAVRSSPIARKRGFDPSLMPPESIYRGPQEMHLVNYGYSENLYQLYAYVNPGESGYVHLKTFDPDGSAILDEFEGPTYGVEYTGWSTDPDEKFLYNPEMVSFPGLDFTFSHYPVKLELWFAPDSGAPERKLMEKWFMINS